MNKRKMFTAFIVMLTMLLTTFSLAYATSSGSSTGTANVGASAPTISSPQLWNSAEDTDKNNTALVVATEYHLNFTVGDGNGLNALTNVTIRFYDSNGATENGTDAQSNHYTFCYNSSGTGAWTGTPSSTNGGVVTANCYGYNGSATSAVFRCAFKLSKVAKYESVTTNWKVSIFAFSAGGDVANKDVMTGVAFYSEISSLASTHTWTGLTAGSSNNVTVDAPGYVTFSALANGVWKAQCESNDTVLHSGANTIPINPNLVFHHDTLVNAAIMTTSYQDIGGLTSQAAQTAEASPTATYVTLWLTVPAGTPSGAYVYQLNVQITQ